MHQVSGHFLLVRSSSTVFAEYSCPALFLVSFSVVRSPFTWQSILSFPKGQSCVHLFVICVCGLDVRWQCWRYFCPQPNSQRTAACMYLWLSPRWVGVGGTSANWITTYNYFWSRDSCGSTACAYTMLFSWSSWTLIPYLWRRLEPLQALLQIINCCWVKSSLAQREWRRACGDIPPIRDLCKGMSL